MTLKAIPTTYRGISMRSRLEARFATELDRRGIAWVYEAEGYALSGNTGNALWYLPDFWAPSLNLFFEVKGVLDTVSAGKMRALAVQSGREVVCVLPFNTPEDLLAKCDGAPGWPMRSYKVESSHDDPQQYLIAGQPCGFRGIGCDQIWYDWSDWPIVDIHGR